MGDRLKSLIHCIRERLWELPFNIAVFEAYVGGRWYTFDATQPALRGGYVVLGYGRDAADVAVFNQFGPASFATAQAVRVERLHD
ncbi:hypothetical protein [Marinobacterium sedimentorum]|uniref:hypothetical protein n=1 Tax=Marinobacterium sedimentorum TaxID=2927804 RepID=UPI0020C6D861|nr:hypothetical protein [Marinobacterium sedimentorum]MCP8687481.1 hypothetical protein [Marinobacterium sedimentorum]